MVVEASLADVLKDADAETLVASVTLKDDGVRPFDDSRGDGDTLTARSGVDFQAGGESTGVVLPILSPLPALRCKNGLLSITAR
jgi:hypothetical protein